MIVRRAAGGEGGTSFATEIAGDPTTTTTDDSGAQGAGGDNNQGEGAGGEIQKPAALPNWATSASKELRGDPRFGAYAGKYKNSLDEALKAAMDLEDNAAKMLKIPGEDATDDEKAAYRKAIGLPVKADEYVVDAKKYGLTDEQAGELKNLCFEWGMTTANAGKFLDFIAESNKQTIAAYKEQVNVDRKETEAAFKKEWGAKYAENIQIVQRGMRSFGTEELIKDIETSGIGNKKSVIELFHKLGQMTREDSAIRGAGSRGNPGEDVAGAMYPSMRDKK